MASPDDDLPLSKLIEAGGEDGIVEVNIRGSFALKLMVCEESKKTFTQMIEMMPAFPQKDTGGGEMMSQSDGSFAKDEW